MIDNEKHVDLTLAAAISAKSKGVTPYILVTNGDTGVENPEIAEYSHAESKKILEFASKNEIDLDFHVARPTLNSTWAVSIIGGRSLPSFPNNNADCICFPFWN